ncbi:hypothetical protein FJ987_19820 [Mesorhizobium sp. CU2]|nr:hypothetical protein FJ987_19820 [Mesorhizobium sp. CU2]
MFKFEPLTIGARTELHRLVRLRVQIMQHFDNIDHDADMVLKAAAELVEAVEPEEPIRLPKAGWTLGL